MPWRRRGPRHVYSLPALGQLAGWTCLLLAAAATVFAGWWRADNARIRLSVSGAEPLGDVRIVVGGEKTWWPELRPGESVGVVLNPLGETPRLHLQFDWRGQRRYWDGPDLGAGVGYAIGVDVHADGTISEKHCLTPCWPP